MSRTKEKLGGGFRVSSSACKSVREGLSMFKPLVRLFIGVSAVPFSAPRIGEPSFPALSFRSRSPLDVLCPFA